MRTRQLFALMVMCMLVFQQLPFWDVFGFQSQGLSNPQLLGTLGTEVADPNDVYYCTDPAFTYIGCDDWLALGVPADYYGTIVVMDDQLTPEQWYWLEDQSKTNGYWIDIIKYVTVDPQSDQIVEVGSPGIDQNLTPEELNSSPPPNGYSGRHLLKILSVISALVRHARIIVIDLDMDAETGGDGVWSDPGGFSVNDNRPYEWIKNNIDTYDIDVVSISWVIGRLEESAKKFQILTNIKNKGVFIVNGIGNDGIDGSDLFPTQFLPVYSISSQDHENRGTNRSIGGINFFDKGYYSSIDSFSGDSDYGRQGCPDAPRILCSNWGGSSLSDPGAVHFAMPGNGVPSVNDLDGSTFIYDAGTSFSAPMAAAAALVAVYAFNKASRIKTGNQRDPTFYELYDILRKAAQYPNSWNYKLGYGHIDLRMAYQVAYDYLSPTRGTCSSDYCFY